MAPRPPLSNAYFRLAVAAVVLAASGLATFWVFFVPIYQAPDEQWHLDYALCIYAHHGLLRAHNTAFEKLPLVGHPWTTYLETRTNLWGVAFHPNERMSADYGTRAYYAALDRDAPPAPPSYSQPVAMASVYPFGYYGLLAAWIALIRLGTHSLVATFFAARLFSVLLLTASLLLTYGTVRLLHFKRGFSLLLTACVGFFPMTSFVASYVQPDNLAFTLVSLCFYLSLKARASGFRPRYLGLLGLAFGGLLVTKTHFWLCVFAPVLAMLVVEMAALPAGQRHWLRAAMLLVLPSLAGAALSAWLTWGTRNYYRPSVPNQGLLERVGLFRQALLDFYNGTTHESFWGTFGWMDTGLIIHNQRLNTLIRAVLRLVAWALLALTLLRLEQVTSRLLRVARRGRPWWSLRAAFSNPVLNSYFLFTAVMVALYIHTGNRFSAQGRNWLPYLLPTFLVGLVYAPGALSLRGSRRLFTAAATAGLLLYCVFGSRSAIKTLEHRFYQPSSGPKVSAQAVPNPAADDDSPAAGFFASP